MILNYAKDGWDIAIDPGSGAAIRHCRFDGDDVLRPFAGGATVISDPLRSAGFCLVPFSNRIGSTGFDYNGRRIQLTQTRPDFPLPIHGYGWVSEWSALPQDDDSVALGYRYTPGDGGHSWPWAFKTEQTLTADGNALTHTLSVTNLSETVMPAGLGFHPYFPNIETAILTVKAGGVYHNGPDNLPGRHSEIPAAWDFSAGARPAGQAIDNCFTAAGPEAVITGTLGSKTVRIESSPELSFAVVYTAEGDGSFCYEPVSHANNALNMKNAPAGTGLKDLAPGDVFTVWMRYIIA